MKEVVIGIDLGTQGVRALAVNARGEVQASAQVSLQLTRSDLPPGWFEQSPREWLGAVKECLLAVSNQLSSDTWVVGICIDSTSGTILPIHALGKPLYSAIMYNDQRSEPQVNAVQVAGKHHQVEHGYRFGSSFALPKILWFQQNYPDLFAQTSRFIHQADYIVGKLTGIYSISDTSHALKTGYDLIHLRWPGFIFNELGIPLELLPNVVFPGTLIGKLTSHAAEEIHLHAGISVYAGATDGTAAQIASGAAQPGDWNSTLGTTLVLKGISRDLVLDPLGRIYSHRHPEGFWMPGGASNTGGEWISLDFPQAVPTDLDSLSRERIPTKLIRYPLCKRGERFPFFNPGATGFLLGQTLDDTEYYAAGLEGLAFLEKLAYVVLQEIGLEVGEKIYITGGGTKSNLWSQIRASVLNRSLLKPVVTETAMGAAIIAASGCWYKSLLEASSQMVNISKQIDPNPVWGMIYEDRYGIFIDELRKRGYLL